MDYLPEALPAASSRSLRLQKLPVQITTNHLPPRHPSLTKSPPRVLSLNYSLTDAVSSPSLSVFSVNQIKPIFSYRKLYHFLRSTPIPIPNPNPNALFLSQIAPSLSRSAAYLRLMTAADRFACAGEPRSRCIHLATRSVRNIFGSAIFCSRLDRIP